MTSGLELGLYVWALAAAGGFAALVARPLFATTASLALLQVALETTLYLVLAAGVARAGSWFRRPKVRRRLEAVSGTVFVGLGVRVAASSS